MNGNIFLIVEDHPVMAEMISKSITQVEPHCHCLVAENIEQAKERLKLETPNFVSVDLMFRKMGEKNSGQPGLELVEYILENYPQLDILVYSTEPSLLKPLVKKAQFHQGSFIVADKQQPPKDFIDKIRMIIENKNIKLIPRYLSPKSDSDSFKLTSREKEILKYACLECLTDNIIADKLFTSRKTVQGSMKTLREKLGIFENRSEKDLRMLMCKKAREEGLI